MLPYLSNLLTGCWGPFRLFNSYMVLMFIGALLGGILTWHFLPRLWFLLPRDQGKPFVLDSQDAKGTPTGAGLILVCFFLLISLLITPPSGKIYGVLGALFLCMLSGYLDDRSAKPWGQLKKGLLDLLVSLMTAYFLHGLTDPMRLWVPFAKGTEAGGAYLVPAWAAILISTGVLWICINVVNCSDGVDGLVGSLALLSLLMLGALLYGIIGNINFATYLLVPFSADAAPISLLIFTMAGVLCGYLWHNAAPACVMMGDAGSRFLGLLIGAGVIASGNYFLLLVVCPIMLLDGGLGLLKLVFLRLLKKMGYDTRPPLANVPNPVHPENFADEDAAARQLKLVRFIHRFRLPFHDHCKRKWHWSGEQVLVRFVLLQIVVGILLIVLCLKIR